MASKLLQLPSISTFIWLLSIWFGKCRYRTMFIGCIPVFPIEIPGLHVRKRARVDTFDCHSDSIRVRPRGVKRCNATYLAECMLRCVCSESVCCEKLLGISNELKFGGWDYEVDVASHGTVGTVAAPWNDAWWCLDLPPNVPAVTSAAMNDSLGVHPCCRPFSRVG